MSSSYNSSYLSYDENDYWEQLKKRTANCIRNVANFSKVENYHMMDKSNFVPELLDIYLKEAGPKVEALMERIRQLDEQDLEKEGKHFKHMIFTDVKSSSYGAKLIGSVFVAKGYQPAFHVQGPGFTLHPDEKLLETPGQNFGILMSKNFYDRPMSIRFRKHLMETYNRRPENVQGNLVRFIILDQGFKEGIDLFDVKYVHLFEPVVVKADEKQAIGRGTRFCGQSGLQFHPKYGWPLYVFRYEVDIPKEVQSNLQDAKQMFELYLNYADIDLRKVVFAAELERVAIDTAVDKELTASIHQFKVDLPPPILKGGGIPTEEIIRRAEVMGNNAKKLKSIAHRPEPPSKRMDFDEMRKFVRAKFRSFAYPNVKLENQCTSTSGGAPTMVQFTPTQDFVRHYFQSSSAYKGILLFHSVGTGKCHAKDTPILMYDGSIKMVQDIEIGDLLMGDDSTPRRVLSLAQGTDEMYDIVPVKGDKYTVNSEHILVLKYNSFGITKNHKRQPNTPYRVDYFDNKKISKLSKSFKTIEEAVQFLNKYKSEEKRIVEIPVNKFINLAPSLRRELRGFRKGVDFVHKELPLDPYFIGVWLGDGGSRTSKFTTADPEILEYMTKEVEKFGLNVKHEKNYDYIISGNGKVGNNFIINTLRRYNLLNNKHIPTDYLINSRENRLKLLAGLIDTDGYYDIKGNVYEITQKSNVLADGILFLARSLGFAAYLSKCKKGCMYKGVKKEGIYNRIHISGDIEEIPVILPRKKANKRGQIKDVLVTGITVNSIGKGQYYGFTLDGNNRYLLGDFTVTHNTCSAIATATNSFEREGYTILWVTRHTLKNDIWKNMYKQVCSLTLQEKIKDGSVKLPERVSNPKKYLPENWMEPISYKQFSNLLLKKNKYYEEIVKRNGKEDPLRKTLVIIDEAHKLYSPTVVGSEKPRTDILEEMIQHSYKVSGKDSVRVLLMTATPYTEDGMEMIQLLNLLRDKDLLPTDFEDFKSTYLDSLGYFKSGSLVKFQNQISGYISYLNRSSDARNFAYPVLQDVHVDLTYKLPKGSDESKEKPVDKYKIWLKELRERMAEKKNELRIINAELKEDKKGCKGKLQQKKLEMKAKAAVYIEQKMKELEKEKENQLEKCEKITDKKQKKACIKEAKENYKKELKSIREQKKTIAKSCVPKEEACKIDPAVQKKAEEKMEELDLIKEEKLQVDVEHDKVKEEIRERVTIIRELREEYDAKREIFKELKEKIIDKRKKIKKIKDKELRKEAQKVFRNTELKEYKAQYKVIRQLRLDISKYTQEKRLLRLKAGKALLGDVTQMKALEKRCKVTN